MTHSITEYSSGGVCDPKSGACSCAAGWRGALCDDPCPPGQKLLINQVYIKISSGTHGANCTSSCLCQNQGNCHPVTGICHCPMGWTVSCVPRVSQSESTLCCPGRGVRQPLPHRHLPRGLQAAVRLLQRRGV